MSKTGSLGAPPRVPKRLVVLLGALTAFGALSIDMYLPSLPSIARSLRSNGAMAEMTVAAFYVGLSLGQLGYGPVSDRIGRRAPLLAGIGLYVAASLGCALSPSVGVLIGLRFVQALGACAGIVIARAVVRDRFDPQQTAHVFSLLMLVMGLAPILAPLAGGFILLAASWRAIFGVLAGFGLAVGVATAFALGESRSAETELQARSESPFRAYAALLGERRVMGFVLAGAFAQASLLTYIASSPGVVIGTFHVPAQDFGWVFGTNGAGLIAATQVNRRLLRSFTAEQILRQANLITFVCSLALVVTGVTGAGGLWGVLIPLFLVVASLGFSGPNALAGAMAVDPRRAGSTAALAGSLQFAVGAGCAALAGALSDGTPRPMAAVIAAALLAAVVSLRVCLRRASRPVDSEAPSRPHHQTSSGPPPP